MDSNESAAGSENSFAEKNSELVLSDQIFNCSVAAALNVSAATRPTFFFSLIYLLASLPTVAVLPTPLIPTIRKINGLVFKSTFFSNGCNSFSIFFCITILTFSELGSIILDFRRSSIISEEKFAPKSDDIKNSSSSSKVVSLIFFPLITFFIPSEIFSDDFESPDVNFLNHPKTNAKPPQKIYH